MIPADFPKPLNWQDFERLCHELYRAEFRDLTAMANGRPGQKQFGVDIYATSDGKRIGIQCKRYNEISTALVIDEIANAEKGDHQLDVLIVATTADNDAETVREVVKLSDARAKEKKFRVALDAWDAIQRLLNKHIEIAKAIYRGWLGVQLAEPVGSVPTISGDLTEIRRLVTEIHSRTAIASRPSATVGSVPATSPAGLNRIVSNQFDEIRLLLRSGRTDDAKRNLDVLKNEFDSLEPFHKFR